MFSLLYGGWSLVHIFIEYLSLPIYGFLPWKQNLINSAAAFSKKEQHEFKTYSFMWVFFFCLVLPI